MTNGPGRTGPCIDGLLWIGGTYKSILCGKAKSCAIPAYADCFVHEAEWRGISRKVPHVPQWAVPGKSRIFLAYAGRIFGYFVLHRVEVLGAMRKPVPTPDVEGRGWSGPEGKGLLVVDVYEAASGRPVRGVEVTAEDDAGKPTAASETPTGHYELELDAGRYTVLPRLQECTSKPVPGVEVAAGKRRKLDVFLEARRPPAHERRKRCWDGSQITTHIFKEGRWEPTGEKCPPLPRQPPRRECDEGQVQWGICPDGSIYPAAVCRRGRWESTGIGCPGPGNGQGDGDNGGPRTVPIEPDFLSPHRSCSLRTRPGAIYLVDRLCAEITDAFAETVRAQGWSGSYRGARSDPDRSRVVAEAHREFVAVVDRIHTHRRLRPRAVHGGRAVRRGDLVLFGRPVAYEAYPRAAFRSLKRIDGDDLLKQILAGVPRALVRPCVPPGKGKSLTRAQLAARLAAPLHLSQAIADRFLTALFGATGPGREEGIDRIGLVRRELAERGVLRLPRFGTLRVPRRSRAKQPPPRSIPQSTLVERLAKSLAIEQRFALRLLHRLHDVTSEELAERAVLRLPAFGTFRCRGGAIAFAPAKALSDIDTELTLSSAWKPCK